MMSVNSFGISGPNAPAISEKIVASTLNAIQQLLSEDKIRQFCADVQYTWGIGFSHRPSRCCT
jgi:hypothetical protein